MMSTYALVPYTTHEIGPKMTPGKVVGKFLLPEEQKGEQVWVKYALDNGYPEDVK